MVPANVTGPIYVFITVNSPSNTNGATSSTMVVAGPALLFVNQPDLIGSQIRPGSNVTGATAGSHTTTMPPIVSTTSPVTGMRLCPQRLRFYDSVSQEQPPPLQWPRILLQGPQYLYHRRVFSQLQYPLHKLVLSCPVWEGD